MTTLRTFYDSITPTKVPADGDGYMGYDDGQWPDAAELAKRFPGKTVIRVTTNPTDNEGDMLDVEAGDAAPVNAPAWIARRKAAGHGGPLVYFPTTLRTAVKSAFQGAHMTLPGLFPASYPGPGAVLVDPATDVGHQYASNNTYDTSVVVGYLPGIDPTPPSPTPPPAPTTKESFEMYATDPDTGIAYATDPAGNLYGDGAVPHVVTLSEIRTEHGGHEGEATEPCVGITPEKDVGGTWGYTYITKPSKPNPASKMGPYNKYHVNRDGSY